MRTLFEGGYCSRAETIRGNTVVSEKEKQGIKRAKKMTVFRETGSYNVHSIECISVKYESMLAPIICQKVKGLYVAISLSQKWEGGRGEGSSPSKNHIDSISPFADKYLKKLMQIIMGGA